MLRFKDNDGREYAEWKLEEFSSIVTKVNDCCRVKVDEPMACIELEHVEPGTGSLIGDFSNTMKNSVKTKFAAGDVLFGKLRPYLRKYHLAKFHGVCTSEIWVFRPNSIGSEYLYFVVQGQRFFRAANQQFGSKMPRSDWNIISTLNIPLPSDAQEQQKIANFLSSIDTRIEQLEKKKSLLEQYKKGLMQKLFSQEISFRDDQGEEYPEWHQKRVKEVCEINPKNGCLPENFIYIDLESVEKGILLSNNKINRSNAPSRAQRVLQKRDVLFQSVRPYQQNNLHFENNGSFVASTGYTQLRTSGSSKFLYYLLHTKATLNRILAACTGTSYPAITSSDLGNIAVFYPSLQEQQKIADFLSSVDRKIELVTEQINQTREFKKGLLQQMFV